MILVAPPFNLQKHFFYRCHPTTAKVADAGCNCKTVQ